MRPVPKDVPISVGSHVDMAQIDSYVDDLCATIKQRIRDSESVEVSDSVVEVTFKFRGPRIRPI